MLKYEGVGVCHAMYCDSTVTGEYSEKNQLDAAFVAVAVCFYLFIF